MVENARVHSPGFVMAEGTVEHVWADGWMWVHWDTGGFTMEEPGAVVEGVEKDVA